MQGEFDTGHFRAESYVAVVAIRPADYFNISIRFNIVVFVDNDQIRRGIALLIKIGFRISHNIPGGFVVVVVGLLVGVVVYVDSIRSFKSEIEYCIFVLRIYVAKISFQK